MDIILAMVAILIQGMMTGLFVTSFDVKRIENSVSTPKSLVVNSQKEVRSYGAGVLIGIVIMGVATFFCPLPAVTEIGIALGGIIAGFVVALFRFNHWDEVMTNRLQQMKVADQPSVPTSRKVIFGLFLLSFGTHMLSSRVRTIVGTDIFDLAFSLLVMVGVAAASGYWLEHITLYWLHHTDLHLSDTDEGM
jgi:hypothetical protein